MNTTFKMLIFDEAGRAIKTKDPLRFITRRAKMPGYELKVTGRMVNGDIELTLEFHGCHVILTGHPLDFFFAFACAIKGKYLAVEG